MGFEWKSTETQPLNVFPFIVKKILGNYPPFFNDLLKNVLSYDCLGRTE